MQPTADRIGTLDFVRGAALFGILLMNITGFGLSNAYADPVNNGGHTGADLWSWIIIQIGFEGTQRALFSLLFGAGIILLTTRLEGSGRAENGDIFFRRNLWLIGLGLLNAWILLWSGDILYHYGITALIAFPFRKMAPRSLLVIGVAVLAFGTALNINDTMATRASFDAAQTAQVAKASGAMLSPDQKSAIETWKEIEMEAKPPPATIAKDIAAHRQGWWQAWRVTAPMNSFMESSYLYRYFGDVFGMMLIGMALFRMGVLTLDRPARFYWTMLVIGYGIGFAVNIAETRWIIDHDFSVIAFTQTEASYDLGRLTTMAGHLAALLLFYRSGLLPWLRRSLSAVGQMALTNYLTHSLVCLILFVGFGLYGQLARHQLYYIVFAIWAVQLAVSPIWLRHFRFGPVEWLWRSLTYQRRQPFRRTAIA